MDSVRAVVINSTTPSSVHNDYFVDSNSVRVVPTFTTITTICQGDSIKLAGAYQHNAGIYYDTLQAQAGYDSLIQTTLAITPLPVIGVSGTPTVVCSGDNVVLSASGGTTYMWSANAGSATTTTVQVNPTAGNNTYTVTGTATGCSDKATVTIAVNPLPGVTASASADTICAGSNVTLVGGGANTYTWTGGAVNWIPFAPASTATYTVTGTGSNGCKNSASVEVVVNTCAGIRQIAEAGVTNVYPIPATNSLFVELTKDAKMKLMDIAGQTLMEQNVYAGKNEINISSLAAGAYDLVINASGHITYVKVMVSK
jgi:hypothetical protein